MTTLRRTFAHKRVGFAAGFALLTLAAAGAFAATVNSTIWTYYNSQGHILGNAGLNCDGGVFEYDGDLPDGGYVRRVSHSCYSGHGGVDSVTCYFVAEGPDGPSLHVISCTQMPGF